VGLDLVQIMNDLLMTWRLKSSSAATGCWAILRKLLGLRPLSPGAATPTILTQASPNPNGLNTNVTVSVGIADRYQLLIRRDEMVIVGPNA
jgi:hypothetical protein